MKLQLDAALGKGYPSASQWARRVTEGWAMQNLYCPACTASSLQAHANNRAVEDFHCGKCGRQVQVKAKNGAIGATVANSAYERKATAILANRAPDYCFMGYDRAALLVHDVLWVPGHFMTLSVISKRKALRESAQRSGWVGSNIHLNLIPAQGKIPMVLEGVPVPPQVVRRQFARTAFVSRLPPQKRGWVTDVLACLDWLDIRPGATFSNGDVFSCESRLQDLHPDNHHIKPKVRQQLQVLAKHGVIRRLAPGRYERL